MSEWLRDSLSFCLTYWWAFVALIVPIAGLREFLMIQTEWYGISSGIETLPDMFLWSLLAVVIIESFLQISVIILVQAILGKQNQGFAQRSSRALMIMLPFIFMELMMGFSVAAGLLVFIVPGIFILVRLSLAPYFLVIQSRGALASLKDSWACSRGYGWDLFFGLVVTTLVSLIPTFFMLEGTDSSTALLSNAVLSVLSTCLGVWGAVFFYRAFDYVQANPRFVDQ
ncbi:MAG: YciC family protein [Gammaproteobacteria bacterium]|jgi:hypothetical protein|nr:YciC family protein [Gammaproteobacteria bacterium]